jgi:hypothetical protein
MIVHLAIELCAACEALVPNVVVLVGFHMGKKSNDRPPGSSYRPRWVESKGAAGIPRHPITLRFVGYLLFPVGRAGEAQRQSRRNAGGAKSGW